MKRLIFPAVMTVALVASAWRVGSAQDQPAATSVSDLSGKWVLASGQPRGSSLPPFGDDFSIAQDAKKLTVDSLGFRPADSPNDSRTDAEVGVMLPFSIRTIYVLDGIEHPSQVIANRPVIASIPQQVTVKAPSTEESISKATWAGRQLVIMTYNKNKIRSPSTPPSGIVIRRTVRQALSMEANGTLVVETLIVADPLPSAHEAPSPTPVRSTYKKG
jgi:hypothetical protein